MKAGKIFKTISDVLFITGLAVAGVLLYFHFTGKRPVSVFIVSSGSMAPAIPTGSLAIVTPQTTYSFGDIITFYSTPSKKETVTHRIVGIPGGQYKTMGDANDSFDPVLTPPERVLGKVRLGIPYLGFIANWAKTPPGFILLVIVPATIIIYEELRTLLRELSKGLQHVFSKLIKRKSETDLDTVSMSEQIPADSFTSLITESSAITGRPAILIPVFFALLITFSVTVSLFVDRETSAGNILGASASTPSSNPSPTPTPDLGEPFVDFVEAVTGTFGHCCNANDLSTDPLVAANLITAAPDSPPDFDFIQISDDSSITARFVDNKAVDGAGADVRLHVYDTEFLGSALIELSSDCSSFISFGIHSDVEDVDLDLTGSGLTEAVCVRITDQFAEGDTFPTLGFDLDAIEALNSVSVP